MDLYTVSLILGSAGLGLMALGGLGARGGHSHGTGHGHAGGHGGGHTGHGGHGGAGGHGGGRGAPGQGIAHAHHGAAHPAHGASQTSAPSAGPGAPFARLLSERFSALLSPRLWFSMLIGFGATGLLARPLLGGMLLLGVAIAGGVLFEALIVGPFWRFLFRFASNPAVTLESAITDLATAVTSFDAKGQGLISVDVDGQIVQCLAFLRAEDKAAGLRVRSGDAVRIEDVDASRGRCTVSVVRS